MLEHVHQIQAVMIWYVLGMGYQLVFSDGRLVPEFPSTFRVKHIAKFMFLMPLILSSSLYWIVSQLVIGIYQLVVRCGDIVLWKHP